MVNLITSIITIGVLCYNKFDYLYLINSLIEILS